MIDSPSIGNKASNDLTAVGFCQSLSARKAPHLTGTHGTGGRGDGGHLVEVQRTASGGQRKEGSGMWMLNIWRRTGAVDRGWSTAEGWR